MRNKLVLSFIFVLALFLRLWDLANFRCLNWDEAAFTYNSFSILETAKDEYGETMPLQFKSVGDYKTPLYIYLMVPVIRVFGLNEFSVRLVPALLGSLTVVLAFFITQTLFKRNTLSIFTSFFLAISPWHLQFTRAGADVAVGNFFVTLGILGFLLGVKGKRFGFVLSFAGFSLAIYSYFGDRLFTPIIGLFLVVYFFKALLNYKKRFVVGLVLGLIVILPIVSSLFSAGHKEKILKTTIFGYTRPQEYMQVILDEDGGVLNDLFHTSLLENGWGVLNRYLNHFSFTFLFTQGVAKDPRQFIYGMGLMYLFDLPLILLGIYSLIKERNKDKYFVLGWLLFAPIPAAITRDLTSARRSFNMLIPLLMISSFGASELYNFWKRLKRKARVLVGVLIIAVVFYFVLLYFASYYVFSKNRSLAGPAGWHCGYKELVDFISPIKNDYNEIVVDTTYQGPYIFFLFYEKYPPGKYQPQAKLVQESQDALGEGAGYDNYVFRPIYWPEDRCLEKRLFAGPPERLPQKDIKSGEAEIIKKIYFANGEVAFFVVRSLAKDEFYCNSLKKK